MARMLARLILVTTALTMITASAPAAPPGRVTVQGQLTDSSGIPLPPGLKTFTFSIWSKPAPGGIQVQWWPPTFGTVETHEIATDEQGLWTAHLGREMPIEPLSLPDSAAYLEIGVDAGSGLIILPRVRLESSPYAFSVGTIDGSLGGTVHDLVVFEDSVHLGVPGSAGLLKLRSSFSGQVETRLEGETGDIRTQGSYRVSNLGAGVDYSTLDWLAPNGGRLRLHDASGDLAGTFEVGSGGGGSLRMNRANSTGISVDIDGDDGNSGRIDLRSTTNQTRVSIDAVGTEQADAGGRIDIYNSEGTRTIELDGDEGNVGAFRLLDSDGPTHVRLHAAGENSSGEMMLFQNGGGTATMTVKIMASDDINAGSRMLLLKSDGSPAIDLNAEYFPGGDFTLPGQAWIESEFLSLTGGTDIAEFFPITPGSDGAAGTVVCIDPDHPGKFRQSRDAYDKLVAGIISGAGDVKPGMVLGQRDAKAAGDVPIALSGKVYCLADAKYGAIVPGDLLTTSDTPGHAMRVVDHNRAQGAIIGKAMSGLASGQGHVLVLVTLQ